ncbi:ribonuclease D [Anaplasma phagocytophilum]|uniref:3'-5' exonuclease family protein n=3 Tax=Anaplasma phagocytophilum TaxID=948 RepID=A0A0F3NLH5_ANAPH|nr:ribonuclease D [Anaplasma phagocytophilum]ABD44075.1 putative ribonuclease D [Anaplasma phagocytophilum str. HZ]AGR78620.1 ribonuclease D [Anaplasma phagocytophilum str. HZ2]AGR79867.1 ribonuclease D [Anaplasma phagocytophilum str. JM]AGR81122.1 ribonuclease D [Anaplasma phagocytophilum str. Dog2]EOA61730.1 ribonuclease D [Anaplasma phagocytophilum str. HGE1]
MFICSTNDLSRFCTELLRDNPESVAIDTEFLRSFNDYYPKLCLLQIAYENKQCVIDALAEGIDLTPLQEIFDNTQIFKVFHDCRQDLDALSLLFESLPRPIFDTQIAAMLCEYHENSVGYSKLVEQFLGVKLNKMPFKRVDWSKRPLTESEVRYALDDVIYLYKLYGILRDILTSKGRLSWYMEEMDCIVDSVSDNYTTILESMECYADLTEQEANIARSVVEWRERVARLLNINRNIIMNARDVLNITKDFIADGSDSTLRKYVRELYLQDLPFSLTEIVENNKHIKQDVYNKASQERDTLSLLSILLHSVCIEDGVSQKLVASKRDLVRAISRLPSNIMRGWRYEFFGHKVKAFIEGQAKLVFSVDTNGGDVQLLVDSH